MLERRFIAGLQHDGRTLRGRALRYGDEARILTAAGRPARERFAAGAFGDVARLDTTLDLMHDRRRLLARIGAGLTLYDDGRELRLEAVLPETRDAEDTLTLVRSGVLRGFSIEFDATRDQWAGELRTVTAAALPSIGVVDRPAYVSAEGIEIRRMAYAPGDVANRPDSGGVQVPPWQSEGAYRADMAGPGVQNNADSAPRRRRRLFLWL